MRQLSWNMRRRKLIDFFINGFERKDRYPLLLLYYDTSLLVLIPFVRNTCIKHVLIVRSADDQTFVNINELTGQLGIHAFHFFLSIRYQLNVLMQFNVSCSKNSIPTIYFGQQSTRVTAEEGAYAQLRIRYRSTESEIVISFKCLQHRMNMLDFIDYCGNRQCHNGS